MTGTVRAGRRGMARTPGTALAGPARRPGSPRARSRATSGSVRSRNRREWRSRTWATLIWVVTPLISAISWL
ncbi:hypothetical protein Maq22A_c28340 [Methylobacterium aquaticum]|uniref:Uncharacterized protein n=1 Tax=Methylobacterium aquaticum TaxID=270351 RepID=A0A1Y0ZIL7_9HYPH|nr:hypothetical protein Maq22A_c28340 [Methylobacterium aquaticum]